MLPILLKRWYWRVHQSVHQSDTVLLISIKRYMATFQSAQLALTKFFFAALKHCSGSCAALSLATIFKSDEEE